VSTDHPGSDEARRLFADFVKQKTKQRAILDQPTGAQAIKADIMRISLESMRDHLRLTAGAKQADGTAFRAYAGYVDSFGISGISGAQAGCHFCALYLGLAAACYEFANFCFSQTDMFRDIGDPDKEISPEPLDRTVPGLWMRGKGRGLETSAFVERGRTYLPRCSERETKALLLALLMLRVVWLHELAHCLNGHVDWSFRAYGLTCLFDGHDPDAPPQPHVPQAHLLEYDADQSALMLACKVQIAEAENISGLLAMPLVQRLHWTLFAAYVVTLILAMHERIYPPPNRNNHPSPEARLVNQVRTVASNILPLSPAVKAANTAAFADLSRLSALVPAVPDISALVTGSDTAALHDDLDKAQDDLEHLRAHWQGLAYRAGP